MIRTITRFAPISELEWAGRLPEHMGGGEQQRPRPSCSCGCSSRGISCRCPSTETARVRQLSRGGRRKNDHIHAAADACVAALQGEGRPIYTEDYTSVLRVLDERRRNLLHTKGRLINQLHAILRPVLTRRCPNGSRL